MSKQQQQPNKQNIDYLIRNNTQKGKLALIILTKNFFPTYNVRVHPNKLTNY